MDANGNVVFRILDRDAYRNVSVPMDQAYELARIVAEAVNEKFATKAQDSPSPF